jgi:Zn ribbon nucleic-acid-binding protein
MGQIVHVCSDCGSSVFTLANRDGVSITECLSCGSTNRPKELLQANNGKMILNTGVNRERVNYKSVTYTPHVAGYRQKLQEWKNEWRKRIGRSTGNVGFAVPEMF